MFAVVISFRLTAPTSFTVVPSVNSVVRLCIFSDEPPQQGLVGNVSFEHNVAFVMKQSQCTDNELSPPFFAVVFSIVHNKLRIK